MNNEIFGTLKAMKRAKSDAHLLKAAKDYLKSLDSDIEIRSDPFTDIDAVMIKVFFNQIELAELAEHLECSMTNLMAYARVLSVSPKGEKWTAKDLDNIAKRIKNKESPTQVFASLGLSVPDSSLSISIDQRKKLKENSIKLSKNSTQNGLI
jgi:hypothetical protein